MVSMKDSDTSLWLHNKLGSTDELWAPSSIATLLTNVIDNLQSGFSSLSTPVKLKLLLGMLHLPRCTTDDKKRKKESLSNILRLAKADPNDWVRMVAAILKPFPETGSLDLDLEELNPSVLQGGLRRKVNDAKCESSAMLPLECKYLDKEVRETLVGPLAAPVKHFHLKREPKSATLREELLQKSKETVEQLRRIVVPFHANGLVRNIDAAATPAKGGGGIPKAPSHAAAMPSPSVFSPPTNHMAVPAVWLARKLLQKKRGVKLLDISELQVSAGRENKRRKALETEAGEKVAKEETAVENITPD